MIYFVSSTGISTSEDNCFEKANNKKILVEHRDHPIYHHEDTWFEEKQLAYEKYIDNLKNERKRYSKAIEEINTKIRRALIEIEVKD